jgi:hypothetical protein
MKIKKCKRCNTNRNVKLSFTSNRAHICNNCKEKEVNRKNIKAKLLAKVKSKYKTCPVCKDEKLKTEFHKNKSTLDGYQYICATCQRAKVDQYQSTNPNAKEVSRRAAAKWIKHNPHKLKQYAERQAERIKNCDPLYLSQLINHRKGLIHLTKHNRDQYSGILKKQKEKLMLEREIKQLVTGK